MGFFLNLGCIPGFLSESIITAEYFYAFIVTSVLLNIFLTVVISRHLLRHRRISCSILSRTESDRPEEPYTVAVTLVVESALAWTIAGLIYMITLVLGHVSNMFFEYVFHITVVCISALSPVRCSRLRPDDVCCRY
jgi:hypothetical protein